MKATRILVVDDEPGIRQSLGGVLEDEGYTVETAASGENCLQLLGKKAFDAVLLDVWILGWMAWRPYRRFRKFPRPTDRLSL